MINSIKCLLELQENSYGVFITFKAFIYIVNKFEDSHSCRMMWSEAILMMTKNVRFLRKSKQYEEKKFFEDLGKAGENRNRPVIRERGRVITFEDGKDLGCFEIIQENTLKK